MSEIKLLPCPFCDGEVMLDREYIFCDECHLIMRIDDRLYNKEAETYEEARKQTIEAWNTRKLMERIIKRICNVRNNTPNTDFKNGCNASLHQIHREIDIDVKEEGGIE